MGREDPVHWRLESGDLCRPTGCLRGHRCQHNVERIPRGRICSSELRLWPPGWSKRKYEAAILLANRRTRRVEINWYEARTQTQMASGLTLYRIQQASGTIPDDLAAVDEALGLIDEISERYFYRSPRLAVIAVPACLARALAVTGD